MLSLLATILYALVPGHPDLPVHGLPLGLLQVVGLVGIVMAFAWSRPAASSAHQSWTPIVVLAVAAAVKITLAFAWFPTGWLTSYYANDSFTLPIERSTDFLPGPLQRFSGEATRLDSAIDFRDTRFPVHFFNDFRFAQGSRREYTDAFSVEWLGHFHTFDKVELSLVLEARGAATLLIDGRPALAVDSPVADGRQREDLVVPRGEHTFSVRYRKPANTEGFVRLSRFEAGITRVLDEPAVFPFPTTGWRIAVKGLLRAAGWLTHGAAFLALAAWLGPLLRQRVRAVASAGPRERWGVVAPAIVAVVMLIAVAEGASHAWPLVDRAWTLTAGDGFGNEARARELLTHRQMTTPGAGVGGAQTIFAGPAYSYFLAAVHRATGESLAGIVLLNFILLGLASAVVFRLAVVLVAPKAAVIAAAWLVTLAQMDVVRCCTVRLLDENLLLLTAAVTVYGLTLYIQRGWPRDLVFAAAAGGLSTLTRPSVLLFLPLAAGVVAIADRRRVGPARASGTFMVFVAMWLLTIAPAAIGNDLTSAAPMAFRVGFSHSIGSVVRLYPELVVTALVYLLSLIVVPRARTLDALPLHCFIATEFTTLILTRPGNDGHRVLLPMFLFLPVFAAAVVLRLVSRPGSPISIEAGEAPGPQGARRKNTQSICPTSNAAGRNASPAECNRTSGTRH